MTMTLIDHTNATAASSKNATLELKLAPSNAAEGPSFGQHLSDMFQLQTHQATPTPADLESLAEGMGQELAESLGAEVAASADAAWLLQAQTLGPNLNVITPASAAPDEQSLEAFALAQGLDAQAVHWLFGGQAGAAANTPLTLTLGQPAGTPTAEPATLPLGASSATVALTGALTGAAGPSTLPPQTPPNASEGKLLSAALAGLQALWTPTENRHPQAAATSTDSTTTAEDPLGLQLLRMPPPAAVWMQRALLNPAVTDPLKNAQESAISMSDLDLGADWGGEVLQELLAQEGNAAGGTTGANATGTHSSAYANFAARWDAQAGQRADLAQANSPATPLNDAAARSENIQNLADKMGQAVGQRILSEMERGQWHLKLSLRPATLGHIEVEMRMRSGELDAVFTAPNAVTRDLLQDGLSKLRETLGQMGMDVANIHVGDGQSRQSGGDPTQGSWRGQAASSEAKVTESTPEIARAPSVKDPKEGLDVLV